MNNTTLTLTKSNIIYITSFITAIGIITLAPLLGQQLITGTIINAVLFTTTIILGVQAGFMIGILPSTIALLVGLLPLALAPMIPFIIVSNVLLVFIFNLLRNKNYWLAVITSSFLKFSFLFLSSWIISRLIIEESIMRNIAIMMSWPQLNTALMGGLLAFLFLKFYDFKK